MTHGTIEETYEYRIVDIIKKLLKEDHMRAELFTDGEELETFLDAHQKDVVRLLLDDISEWMGFDDLLKQVKE